MKTFATTTLALTLAGTTAFAEAHMTDYSKVDSAAMNEMRGDLIRSRDITGELTMNGTSAINTTQLIPVGMKSVRSRILFFLKTARWSASWPKLAVFWILETNT